MSAGAERWRDVVLPFTYVDGGVVDAIEVGAVPGVLRTPGNRLTVEERLKHSPVGAKAWRHGH